MGNGGAKQGFWSHFRDISTYSLRSVLSHPWVLLFLLASNIAFIFLFSVYESSIDRNLKYTLDLLSNAFQTIVQAVDVPGFIASAKQSSLADVLLSDSILQQLAQDLVLLLILFATIAYVTYTFFQSTSVRAIGWMILDKKPYSYFSFIRLNLIWFIIYLAFRILVFVVDAIFTFASSGKTMISDLSILYVVVHVLLFYFVFISYTFADEKTAWRAIKASLRFGICKISTLKYYILNYLPFGLYLIPAIQQKIDFAFLFIVSPLRDVGIGLHLVFLFCVYVFFVANIFTITHEVSKSAEVIDQ